MPEWLKIVLTVLTVVAFIASPTALLWARLAFYTPENLPDLPPEQVLRARRRSIGQCLLRILAYLAVGLCLPVGPGLQALLALVALAFYLASLSFRPDTKLMDERMKEASRQARAAHRAARLEKALGKHAAPTDRTKE